MDATAGVTPDAVAYNTFIACCAEMPDQERGKGFPSARVALAEKVGTPCVFKTNGARRGSVLTVKTFEFFVLLLKKALKKENLF